MPDLALALELGKGSHGLRIGDAPVHRVQLVEVDRVKP